MPKKKTPVCKTKVPARPAAVETKPKTGVDRAALSGRRAMLVGEAMLWHSAMEDCFLRIYCALRHVRDIFREHNQLDTMHEPINRLLQWGGDCALALGALQRILEAYGLFDLVDDVLPHVTADPHTQLVDIEILIDELRVAARKAATKPKAKAKAKPKAKAKAKPSKPNRPSRAVKDTPV